jgi:molybdopterin-guanine dinucleotide biosynthesis protein A
MLHKDKVTGIILAGGKSSRMGLDKGLAMLAGSPLAAYPIRTLTVQTYRIIISSNNTEYAKFGFPVVPDLFPEIGPMGGLYSCLVNSYTETNLVLSCDMPFIKPELFSFLLENSADNQIVLPSFDGIHPEPMCGIYRKGILPLMEKFLEKGNYKLPDLFKEINFRMIPLTPELEFNSRAMLMNINTLEDLHQAEKIIQSDEFHP